mmetsp:Transcript_112843/g.358519  ORF Transcript_112843/g.358519 Transcript_112843/m.358519 type:complete len:336 (-) Transcript_112843:1224-2231(-)
MGRGELKSRRCRRSLREPRAESQAKKIGCRLRKGGSLEEGGLCCRRYVHGDDRGLPTERGRRQGGDLAEAEVRDVCVRTLKSTCRLPSSLLALLCQVVDRGGDDRAVADVVAEHVALAGGDEQVAVAHKRERSLLDTTERHAELAEGQPRVGLVHEECHEVRLTLEHHCGVQGAIEQGRGGSLEARALSDRQGMREAAGGGRGASPGATSCRASAGAREQGTGLGDEKQTLVANQVAAPRSADERTRAVQTGEPERLCGSPVLERGGSTEAARSDGCNVTVGATGQEPGLEEGGPSYLLVNTTDGGLIAARDQLEELAHGLREPCTAGGLVGGGG